jgi:hypothetical protein
VLERSRGSASILFHLPGESAPQIHRCVDSVVILSGMDSHKTAASCESGAHEVSDGELCAPLVSSAQMPSMRRDAQPDVAEIDREERGNDWELDLPGLRSEVGPSRQRQKTD